MLNKDGDNDMIKTYKVMLLPNKKQETRLFEYANAARFVYNWGLAREKEYYDLTGKYLSGFDLVKELTQLKKQDEYK